MGEWISGGVLVNEGMCIAVYTRLCQVHVHEYMCALCVSSLYSTCTLQMCMCVSVHTCTCMHLFHAHVQYLYKCTYTCVACVVCVLAYLHIHVHVMCACVHCIHMCMYMYGTCMIHVWYMYDTCSSKRVGQYACKCRYCAHINGIMHTCIHVICPLTKAWVTRK